MNGPGKPPSSATKLPESASQTNVRASPKPPATINRPSSLVRSTVHRWVRAAARASTDADRVLRRGDVPADDLVSVHGENLGRIGRVEDSPRRALADAQRGPRRFPVRTSQMRTTPSPLPAITERPSGANRTTFSAPLLLPVNVWMIRPDASSISRTSPPGGCGEHAAVGAQTGERARAQSWNRDEAVDPRRSVGQRCLQGPVGRVRRVEAARLERQEQRPARLARRQSTDLLNEASGIGDAGLITGISALLDRDTGGDECHHEQQRDAPDRTRRRLLTRSW